MLISSLCEYYSLRLCFPSMKWSQLIYLTVPLWEKSTNFVPMIPELSEEDVAFRRYFSWSSMCSSFMFILLILSLVPSMDKKCSNCLLNECQSAFKPVGGNAFDSLTNKGRDSLDGPTPSVGGPAVLFGQWRLGKGEGVDFCDCSDLPVSEHQTWLERECQKSRGWVVGGAYIHVSNTVSPL